MIRRLIVHESQIVAPNFRFVNFSAGKHRIALQQRNRLPQLGA